MLYLVRHAEVTVDPSRDAADWLVSAEGLAAANRLAGAPSWRSLAAIASSTEPKAIETARPIAAAAGRRLQLEPGLGEVRRNASWADGADSYIALVERYLSGEELDDWEPAAAARARVTQAMDQLLSGDDPVCVVSHGLVLSLYLGLTADEWRGIALPSVAVVDPSTGRMIQPFTGVEEFLQAE